MHRLALILGLIAAALWGAAASAQAPDLAAKLAACETGADADDRFAVFSGSMPREGATVMALRFDLFERLPGGRFERVSLANWGMWQSTAKKGVPGFIFTKRVEQLAAAAAFRAVVSFRWSDVEGRVVRRAKRTSPVCRQPDWRPDLRVSRVEFAEDGRARATVVNDGRSPSPEFGLTMRTGERSVARTLAGLPAGQRRTVDLGRCRAPDRTIVTVDPAGAIEEADEGDNAWTAACPVKR